MGVQHEDAFGDAEWPQRPWILAALLGALGLIISFLTDRPEGADYSWQAPAWRVGLAAFCAAGGLSCALSLRRDNAREAAAFSLAVGGVIGLLSWHYARIDDDWAALQFNIAASILACLIAVPLFQAGFHRLRSAVDYKRTHFYTWTDAISGALAIVFVGISWGVYMALSELFALIGIEALRDISRQFWFGWTFSALMFGAGLGVLRNQLKILGMLQRVVMLVAGILAVPMAFAIAVFIIAALFSGLDVLWEATDSATPLLLTMSAGSFILIHAIIRDDDEEMSQSRIQQYAAIVLAVGILPLSLFAAISSGLRIGQYGLSPERIWAMIVVSVAVASGVMLYWALLHSLKAKNMAVWPARLRYGNLRFAVCLCALALVLALPIFDFGAISARNQMARLESGAVKAEDFDYTAMRWDFGDAGREALAGLAKSKNAKIAQGAKDALAEKDRPYIYDRIKEPKSEQEKRLSNIRFETKDAKLRSAVEQYVRKRGYVCDELCFILEAGRDEDGGYDMVLVGGQNGTESWHFSIPKASYDGNLSYSDAFGAEAAVEVASEGNDELTENSKVEIRPYTGRQVFVDGKPVGEPFE